MIEIGKKYKEWTVLRQSEKRYKGNTNILYECKCKCGRISYLTKRGLESEDGQFFCKVCRQQSIGSKAYLDFEGKKFGNWTVVKSAPSINNISYFECICKCGKTSKINASKLKHGTATMCRDCSIKKFGGTCKICGCITHKINESSLEISECDLLGFCPRCDKFCCMNCSIDPLMECDKK